MRGVEVLRKNGGKAKYKTIKVKQNTYEKLRKLRDERKTSFDAVINDLIDSKENLEYVLKRNCSLLVKLLSSDGLKEFLKESCLMCTVSDCEYTVLSTWASEEK